MFQYVSVLSIRKDLPTLKASQSLKLENKLTLVLVTEQKHSRGGGGDLLPCFGDVLFQLIQWCNAQFPLYIRQAPLFASQHLGQSLDLLFYLK